MRRLIQRIRNFISPPEPPKPHLPVLYTKEQAEQILQLVIDGCWQQRNFCIREGHQGMAGLFGEEAQRVQRAKDELQDFNDSDVILANTRPYFSLLQTRYPTRAN
jgi:hypothetical protein